jgi:guanylate kinase
MDDFSSFFGKKIKRIPLVIVVSAPSGAGKTTLCGNLLNADPQVKRVITCTTRPPRAGEKDGVDYFFLSRDVFEKKIENGEFLEYAVVHGNYYGTLKSEVFKIRESGNDVLLNIDVQGAGKIRERASQDEELKRSLVTVFVGATGMDVLEERLRKRALDSEETLQRRLLNAAEEIKRWHEFDYLIISGTMEEDLERLKAIVCTERMRTNRLIIV